jgi:Uma2 family endonuclease
MSAAPLLEPQSYRWTRQQFYQLAAQGWFQDRRVELIEGEIIEMPPPGNPHCVSTECSAEVLRNVFGKGYWVRVQMPLNLGAESDPQPDISVVPGLPRNYSDHPTTALLLVEVSDTTLRYDRGRKASLYAKANIADYWIVNLADRQLELRRSPVPDPSQPSGYGYSTVTILTSKDSAVPLAAPQARIMVADLLP